MTPSELGPVSATLEADLRTWVRRHGIVLWLDLDNHYSGFVDRLIRMKDDGSDPVRDPRLPRQPPRTPPRHGVARKRRRENAAGHPPARVQRGVRSGRPRSSSSTSRERATGRRSTPCSTRRQGPASVPSRSRPSATAARFTLEEADAWLADLLADREGGLGSHLRALSLPAVIDDLLGGGFVASRIGSDEDRERLCGSGLTAWTGLPESWREEVLPPGIPRAEDVAFAAAGWALAVEYVDDLKRPPVAARLQAARGPAPTRSSTPAAPSPTHLRERHRAFYRRTADETEAILPDEVEVATRRGPGEDRHLPLRGGQGPRRRDRGPRDAATGSPPRPGRRPATRATSFWLRDDPSRRSAWLLVADAARLGLAIEAAGDSLDARGRHGAGDRTLRLRSAPRWTGPTATWNSGARRSSTRRSPSSSRSAPGSTACARSGATGPTAGRSTSTPSARREGSSRTASLQQRTIFDEVVKPLAQESGTTALFVVDAFRYEMGEELFATLADTPATTSQLRARLAELPTATEVGMNVLAPVADRGRLRPVISDGVVLGFSTGEFRVSDPESRKRAMHDRVGGATCPLLTLEDVVTRESTSLKQSIARARLVVVHSDEIDRAGERGVGPAVFDQVMQKLRAAWRLLRDVGVRRFVFTADHGFLLIDEGARHRAVARPEGRPEAPARLLGASPRTTRARCGSRSRTSATTRPTSLMFPEIDGGLRHRPAADRLRARREQPAGAGHPGPHPRPPDRGRRQQHPLRHARATAKEGVAGMHCVEAKVMVAAQGELGFGGVPEIELSLRVPEASRGPGRALPDPRRGQDRGRLDRRDGRRAVRALLPPHRAGRRQGPGRDPTTRGPRPRSSRAWWTGRFAVTARGVVHRRCPRQVRRWKRDRAWLSESFPRAGVRQLFEHLAAHGAVTEDEAAAMLGGPRELRRFANRFEEYSRRSSRSTCGST